MKEAEAEKGEGTEAEVKGMLLLALKMEGRLPLEFRIGRKTFSPRTSRREHCLAAP